MNYILLNCVLLFLICLSVTAGFQVQQKPRFYGVKAGKILVGFTCFASASEGEAVVKWYKIDKYKEDKENSDQMQEYENPKACKYSYKMKSQLFIKHLDINDSGIYYCSMNKTLGPGTELQVFSRVKKNVAARRNHMKDWIILFQGLLLMLCLIIPLVWYYRLKRKEEAVYEEPERDHTYEGLEIEHCGDLYDDLTAFSPTPDAEATWEIESPKLE